MKQVLFIGITEYNLNVCNQHLKKKFENLGKEVGVFVIARGRPFRRHIWNSEFYLLPKLFYLPAAVIIGSYLCALKKIDVIVCQGPLTEGLMGGVLKMLFRRELIVEVHGDWRQAPFMNKQRIFARILRKVVPAVGGFNISLASKIRTLTHIAQKEMQAQFPDKQYFAFPTFTDIDIFLEEKNTSFQKYICTVAVLSPIKNIETLIEAFAKIVSKFPEFKLVIVGDGPSKNALQATSCKLQVREKLLFTGRLTQEEVKNVVKDCYAFVLPSLSEGFGRVFIEAMALGKPVIGSNVGGVPEIIQDGKNGFLIEPRDTEALAARMEHLIGKLDIAKKMGEAGAKFVRENFSNEKYIKNYVDMIYS